MLNLIAIREAAGDLNVSALEPVFEDHLIAAMADQDRCVTKAYDARISNQDAKAILEQCRMAELHQYVLDCGATFTNELYKLTQPAFVPFTGQFAKTKALAETRIRDYCIGKDIRNTSPPPPAGPAVSTAPTPPATPDATSAIPAAASASPTGAPTK